MRLRCPATRCDPCSRYQDIAEQLLKAEFVSREPVQRALAVYDFGYLFRAVRRTLGLTQVELGEVVGIEQDRISRFERGEHQLRDIETIARIAVRLGIPPALLGFDPNAVTVEKADAVEVDQEVDWVHRRDFSCVAAGALLGLGIQGLDLDRLAALRPTGSTGRIGASDVAAIERTTELFRRMDFSHGGDLCRLAAVAQLRSVLPLRDAACTGELRQRLMIATADLGMVAARASYDAECHNDARRLFLLALSIAGQTEHPLVADLTAYLLMGMNSQALQLGRPQEASSIMQLSRGITTRRCRSPPRATLRATRHAATRLKATFRAATENSAGPSSTSLLPT